MLRTTNRIAFSATLLFGIFAAVSSRAQIVSTFDTDLQGWTVTGGLISYVGVGGNPGGFLQCADADNADMTVYAPIQFQGDLSSYLGSTLSFDAKNINGLVSDATSFGTVTITGPGGTATADLAAPNQPPQDNLWHTYALPLSPALWIGNLPGALSDVSQLSVDLESHNGIAEIIEI